MDSSVTSTWRFVPNLVIMDVDSQKKMWIPNISHIHD
jgi:hypothetical protein